MLLSGKRALVTGPPEASEGESHWSFFSREGDDVAVNYRAEEAKAREVARAIEALGRQSIVIKADISNAQDVLGMRNAVATQFESGIDNLVNNAGIHHHLKRRETDEAEWRRVVAVNIDSGVLRPSPAGVGSDVAI